MVSYNTKIKIILGHVPDKSITNTNVKFCHGRNSKSWTVQQYSINKMIPSTNAITLHKTFYCITQMCIQYHHLDIL